MHLYDLQFFKTKNLCFMNFEQYAGDANKFVKKIAEELGNPNDTDHAYRVMKSVLHTLREVLSPEESLHLISQLPLGIKGVYVDGWHLPVKDRIRSMTEFLECLRSQSQTTAGRDFGTDETAKHHTRCVFNVLKRHVATGEIQHVMDQFPMELTELWITEEDDHMIAR
jgi:uncharacterized protein (DUF2267 family)